MRDFVKGLCVLTRTFASFICAEPNLCRQKSKKKKERKISSKPKKINVQSVTEEVFSQKQTFICARNNLKDSSDRKPAKERKILHCFVSGCQLEGVLHGKLGPGTRQKSVFKPRVAEIRCFGV